MDAYCFVFRVRICQEQNVRTYYIIDKMKNINK